MTTQGFNLLPGTPGDSLSRAHARLTPCQRDAFEAHLLGGTSAEWLSDLLTTSTSQQVSASTIRTYRRRLREQMQNGACK